MSFSKKKIGFFSSILVGISVVSIPSLLLCLGVSKFDQKQLIFPIGYAITVKDGSVQTTSEKMNDLFGGTWSFEETDAVIDLSNSNNVKWQKNSGAKPPLWYLYQKQSTVWFNFYNDPTGYPINASTDAWTFIVKNLPTPNYQRESDPGNFFSVSNYNGYKGVAKLGRDGTGENLGWLCLKNTTSSINTVDEWYIDFRYTTAQKSINTPQPNSRNTFVKTN